MGEKTNADNKKKGVHLPMININTKKNEVNRIDSQQDVLHTIDEKTQDEVDYEQLINLNIGGTH